MAKVSKGVLRAREKYEAVGRAELALMLSDLLIAVPIDAPVRNRLRRLRDRIAEDAAEKCVRAFRKG